MHILLFSSVYPQSSDPARGIYCRNLLKAVVNPAHQVRVVAPYPWTARLGDAFGRGARAEKSGDPGPETDHSTFYDPPCILKRMHGRLMWASARGAIRRVIRDGFRPDCVLSYWTYPNGEAARRAGDGVFVGSGARILGAIEIGDAARIGANAVVLADVSAGATAVGIPAQVVRLRGIDKSPASEAGAWPE